jgi:acetyl-CoA C-acetyltransferase
MESAMGDALILDAVRTPRGRGKMDVGALSHTHPMELMATTLRALAHRHPEIPVRDVEDVVVGCVTQAKEQGACIARNAVLLAGWPQEVTGVTLNRFCGSGLQGVNFAFMGVMSGQQDLAVGGGVESMSRVPMGADGAGLDGDNAELRAMYPIVPQGISADLIATLEGFSRAELDAFAVNSQRKAKAAMDAGRFQSSVVPVTDKAGQVVLGRDEYPRPTTTVEGLGQLEPSFVKLGAYAPHQGQSFDEMALRVYPQAKRIEHRHTAGNSSGIVDGAAAVLIASEGYAKAHGLKPRARVRATATIGAEPVIMLTAPGPASRRALAKAGMQVSDIDLWEINEAFACVPMKTMRDLEIDPEKVNVNGGSIALGHPLGATGAMLLGTVLDELERRDLETALVTLCIGGGMGIATIVERV